MEIFRELKSIESVRAFYLGQPASFLYISSPDCAVCASLFPQIEPILANHPEFQAGRVDLGDVPQIVGEFSVFTAPTLLLFVNGKEVHREARIVPIEPFKRKMEQIGDFVRTAEQQ
ncbi:MULTISPECIES: thioredoxin family protein [Exiguobacterium]|uniref:Thioredoxin family protein n=1 Tax=Exiguobacterium antarcticum TaxID=132920 RepID=A0ABT6R5H8_9BACL|nr:MULTISPECIES: thioredoxin family protein [Exiguobacterium]AFS70683.1 Thioredoxin [Exiguobacterium antarcticum B7]MCT4780431.1 thioredoxin family protein [Exiguobacterium soli]MDI3236210.1 thioredoxin family protein [Exiguobacterium antarcticum]